MYYPVYHNHCLGLVGMDVANHLFHSVFVLARPTAKEYFTLLVRTKEHKPTQTDPKHTWHHTFHKCGAAFLVQYSLKRMDWSIVQFTVGAMLQHQSARQQEKKEPQISTSTTFATPTYNDRYNHSPRFNHVQRGGQRRGHTARKRSSKGRLQGRRRVPLLLRQRRFNAFPHGKLNERKRYFSHAGGPIPRVKGTQPKHPPPTFSGDGRQCLSRTAVSTRL